MVAQPMRRHLVAVLLAVALVGNLAGQVMVADAGKPDPKAADCALLDSPVFKTIQNPFLLAKLSRECGRPLPKTQSGSGPIQLAHPSAPLLGIDAAVNATSTDTDPATTQSETSTALHGNIVCVGYNDDGAYAAQGTFAGFSRSTDGGTTFTDKGPILPSSLGDPVMLYSQHDNAFYFISLSFSGPLNIYKSVDDCNTFSFVGTPLSGFQDHQEAAVDNNPTSPYYGRLYVASYDYTSGNNVSTSYSSDGGVTWSASVTAYSNVVTNPSPWLAVGPGGAVYLAMVDSDTFPPNIDTIHIFQSTNGGTSWTAKTNAANNVSSPGALQSCGFRNMNGSIRVLGAPQLEVSPNGTLHLVYNQRNGTDNGDIYYYRSTDQGTTWSAGVRLNDDTTTTDQWQPALAVNPSGLVAVSWYDRRNDPTGNTLFDHYATTSVNDGQSWTRNVRVTDISSAVPPLNPNFDPNIATCYMGDYDYLMADTVQAYLVWNDSRNTRGGHVDPDVWSDRLVLSTNVGTIVGTVTDASNHSPLSGASVVADPGTGTTYSALTDGSGHYTVTVLSGVYAVTASKFGYTSSSVSGVSVSTGQTVTQNFALTTAPSHTVSGHVHDSSGVSISSATVTILNTPIAPVTTDTSGFYSFTSVPEGTYSVQAAAGNCYDAQTQSLTVNGNETLDFALPQHSDSFGYSCQLVPFSFIDANTVLALSGDDASIPVTLPFPFTFYGQTYSTVNVATNGFLDFLAADTTYSNQSIPSTSTPNGSIYPFWDDLYVDSLASVRTESLGSPPNRQFVIEWRNVQFFADSTRRVRFEVVLNENGQILMQYTDIADDGREQGNSATVGIENETGTTALQYSYDETAISDGLAVLYHLPLASFTDINAALTGVNFGAAAWADYDGDGDPDLVLTGQNSSGSRIAKIYRNDGNGVFTDIGASLAGVWFSSVAWGDYNGDGRLDLVLIGQNSSGSRIAKVYRNDGNGVFTDINAALTGVWKGSVAWGDYDNDGKLDILLTGQDSTNNRITKVYRNAGNGVFTDIGAALTGVTVGSATWGDYDNDGKLDILLTGQDNSLNRVAKVYHNQGGGVFTDIGAALTGVTFSTAVWGDYDNDGKLDILLAGQNSLTTRVSKVYHNDGNGVFTDIGAALTGVNVSSAAWGDYDNDGKLDILLSGDTGAGFITSVYHNDGSGSFTDINAGLTGVDWGTASWGDYDNDGKLDILLTGQDASATPLAKIYRNNALVANTAPTAPTGLTVAISGTSATLSWNAATDGQTPSSGLSYNLRVGTSPGGSDVVPPMALSSGYREIPARGNTDETRTWTLNNLSNGTTYYWSVQAIDTALAGSPFAAEGSFATSPFVDINAALSGVIAGSTAWGDYDGDGKLDVAVTGQTSSGTRIAKIYHNDGNGVFTDIGAALTGVSNSAIAWGDYNKDGRLDLLLSGVTSSNTRVTKVYRNDGNGVFTDIGAALSGVWKGSVAWGDYDNDGDPDILLTGQDSTNTRITRVYRNDGNGVFTDIGAPLTGVNIGSGTWVDYDSDGKLDILITGQDSSLNRVAKIYHNLGSGVFVDSGIALTGVTNSSAAWGDYDGDGDPDLALSGQNSLTTRVTKIYRNDGNGVFTDIGASLTGVSFSSLAWGDYDNDGKLDLLLAGDTGSGPVTRVYRNGGGVFSDIGATLAGASTGTASWGDYDGDGKLDILLSGQDSTLTPIAKIYRNLTATANTVPSAPTGLAAALTSNSATLSWNASTDGQTPSSGLTYNLRVSTTPGGTDVVPPLALSSGLREIPAPGNTAGLRTWTLNNLTTGTTYYWSVQAVDTALAGSPFAVEDSFVPGNLLINPGFESGPGVGWSESSSSGHEIITTQLPHTGVYSAHECGIDNCTDYVQQQVNIPTSGTLTYWWYMTSSEGTTTANDFLRVEAYSLAGRKLASLKVHSNRETRGSWTQDSVSLSRLAGRTVLLRFTTTTNASLPTDFYIDDVAVR